MRFPENLKYSKDHEWVLVENNIATVGITDFAQSELGDIVFVEIETEGEKLGQGDTFGTIEAVKTVSDLFMPVAGEIIEFNNSLEQNPEKVNDQPYEAGWMIKIKMEDENQMIELMTAEEYSNLVG
ncbi:MAG: glycine cleavage system protein H [Bacteroidetes bacterium MED-G17]|nr:MAG: glycine cleavage system protein H [Bacteroidetes bacterium TMED39]PDH52525.1 MAG: glycine cleavage system protein H [Bacteroidetes bacterium MED-G17]CAI8265988.1 MAG: Glycine cleavage system H protein [Bacteroidetes bacterium MED-G17]|tara:strand:- start:19237 stop:19614 length:378 start_codon:yes stop_codon:yes gene_type:complete